MERSRVTLTAVVIGLAAVALGMVIAVWVAFAPSPDSSEPLAGPMPATIADLTGPWKATPMRVDPMTEMKADQACREDPDFPGGLRLALIDARGGGRLPTIYDGGNSMADCVYTTISAGGHVGGSLSTAGRGHAKPGPGRLGPLGGASIDGIWTYTSGRVGQGIVTVVVDVVGIGPITATVQNGWYLAWWEGAPQRGGPPQPRTVTAFDASGTRVDQVTEGQ